MTYARMTVLFLFFLRTQKEKKKNQKEKKNILWGYAIGTKALGLGSYACGANAIRNKRREQKTKPLVR